MPSMKRIFLICLIAVLSAACTYKPTILQGNALEQDTIAQIKPGMPKAEVISILGSPLMQDDFTTDRWDYLYYSIERGQRSQQKSLSVFFNDGIVSKVSQ